MRNSLAPTRPKTYITGPLVDSSPDFPILETADLPSDADWVLMTSLRFDQDHLRDIDPENDRLTQLTIERADFD